MHYESMVGCQLISPIRDFKHDRLGGGLMAMGTEGNSRKRFRVIAGNKSDEISYIHSYMEYSIGIKNPLAQKSKLRTDSFQHKILGCIIHNRPLFSYEKILIALCGPFLGH